MPKRNPPLSRSHYPFRRSGDLGPGPRGRKLSEVRDWKCRKPKGGKKYEQICTYVGSDPELRGTKKRIIRKKKAKSAYEAQYRAWLGVHGPRFANVSRTGYRRTTRRK